MVVIKADLFGIKNEAMNIIFQSFVKMRAVPRENVQERIGLCALENGKCSLVKLTVINFSCFFQHWTLVGKKNSYFALQNTSGTSGGFP